MKTKILIIICCIAAILIGGIAIFFIHKSSSNASLSFFTPVPTPVRSSLSLLTAHLHMVQQDDTTIAVVLTTESKPVTAVQFGLAYNPQILGNIIITPGPFIQNPLVLINTNDPKSGTLLYAIAMQPQQLPKAGKGTVAYIHYTVISTDTRTTTLNFLPNTKITTKGVTQSILKDASGIILPIPTPFQDQKIFNKN